MKRSFRTKISVMAAMLIISISCLFTIFFIHHDRSMLTDQLIRQGELLGSLLAQNTRIAVFAADAATLSGAAEGALAHEGVLSVSIYGSNGKLLVHRGKANGEDSGGRTRAYRHTPSSAFSPYHIKRGGSIEIVVPIEGNIRPATADTLFLGENGTAAPPELLGSVELVMDMGGVNAQMRRLVYVAIVCMVLFLLLGSLCAHLVIRGMTRPLSALMDGVNTLGNKGIYRKIPINSEDEFGNLATAFNGMVEGLQRREQENRLLEKQLRESQEKQAREEWELTFDTVPDLIAILDKEHRIIHINRSLAEHIEADKAAVIGFYGREACGPCIAPENWHADLAAASETGFEREVYDGERNRWYWLTITPLRQLTGETTVTVHVARDITLRKKAEAERKAMQAKLIQANKMTSLGLLVSGMAHDVNNPNSNIIFTAHLLGKAWKDAESILDRYYREEGDFRLGGHWYSHVRESLSHHLTGIRENARRIESIIKNLKDFVRRGKADLDTQMDINRILSVAVSLINTQIKRHTAHFRSDLSEDLPMVRGNPQQLEQVFMNLIMNALQSLPNKERGVTISTSLTKEGRVAISISDEGCGMTPEVKANAFEPFYSTKLDSGGTGLGLAIAKSILDEHEAEITFESSPETGTTFTILLPSIKESNVVRVSASG